MITNEERAKFESYLFLTRKIKRTSSFESHLRRFLNYFKNREFTRDTWNDYLTELLKTNQPQSTNAAAHIAKNLDRFCGTDVMAGYEDFQRPEREVYILTVPEIKELRDAWIPYDGSKYKNATLILNNTYQCLIDFLSITGCRIEEALNVTKSDLTHDPPSVIFRSTKSRQSKKSRRIPLPASLIKRMGQITKENKVFTTSVGGRLFTSHVDRDLKRRAEYVGIHKHITCNLFRHSFISECVKRGVPIVMVARYVGHENIQTTSKYYTHLDLVDLQNAVSVHPLLSDNLTLDIMGERIKLYIDKLVNVERFTVGLRKSRKELVFTIKE